MEIRVWFIFQVMTLHALLMIPDGRGITMQGIPSLMAAKRHPIFQQPAALTAPGNDNLIVTLLKQFQTCKI